MNLIGSVGILLTVVIVVFFDHPSTAGVNAAACLPASWNGSTLVGSTWRGTTQRSPISSREEGGIAAIPPT